MGMVSFAIADAAREAGATLACGVPVVRDRAGRGRDARGRDLDLRRRIVVCNADPKRDAEHARRPRGRRRLPRAARALEGPQPRGEVQRRARAPARLVALPRARTGPRGRRSTSPARWTTRRRPSRRCERGEPAVAFGEVYIQTGYDPSPAPEGKHLMSVFGQYAPYDIGGGRLGDPPRRGGAPVHRPDRTLRARLRGLPDRSRGAGPARTSSRGSGSPAGTSSRAR